MADLEKLEKAVLVLATVVDGINWRRSQHYDEQYEDVLSEIRRILCGEEV